ncbi:hisC [Symbiodinium natans]|uniref:histidinol-phosphate transaminase n=1 Tax=Symbiodinium natans TaxID=878477 RepID=A0A812TNQ9_9DINO|nr:hisC [Symbiodinium natans]
MCMGWSWALYLASEIVAYQTSFGGSLPTHRFIRDKNPPPTAHIKQLKPYLPPLEGRNPKKFTLLDFNERTVEVPDFVKQAMKDFIDNGGLQKYPSYGGLQADIATYAGVKPEQVMFTNGSDQGIDLVIRCCCEKGSEVIIPSPTFAMYEQAAESEGLVIRRPHFTQDKGFPLEEACGVAWGRDIGQNSLKLTTTELRSAGRMLFHAES